VFREEYAIIEKPIFGDGQAHYCKWHPIGHSVCVIQYYLVSCSNGIQQHKPPQVSADATKKKQNVDLFRKFFSNPGVITTLHTVNAISERLDLNFDNLNRRLKRKILQGLKGSALRDNPCHWPGIALHWNQMPRDYHFDKLSLHSGWDIIIPFGPFRNCLLEFPDLGISLAVSPGDIIFIRGAGLKHKVSSWEGDGRMVIVPFVDRRLFAWENSARPSTFWPLYGRDWKNFRGHFPATPLSKFV